MVNPLPVVTLMAYEPMCVGDPEITLYGGMPEDGTYYVDGFEATVFIPEFAGTYGLVYEYTDGNGCTNVATGEMVVNPIPVVTCPDDMFLCEFDQPVELTGGLPEGGSYFGEGVVEDMGVFYFDPAVGPGFYDVVYSYEELGCYGECSFVVEVVAAPVANAGPDATIIFTETYTFTEASVANADSWEWSNGGGDGAFDDNTLLNPTYTPGAGDIAFGSVSLELTATSNLCGFSVDEMTLSIVIDCLNATADAGDDGVICEGETFELFGAAENYTSVLWESTGDGTFADATALETVYTPGADDIANGGADLCLTAFAVEGCDDATDCMTLTINLLPIVTCPDDFAVCIDADPWELFGAAPEGGDYSGQSIVDNIFDPAAAGVGVWEIAYTYTENGCTSSCVFYITVNPLPEVTLAVYEPMCVGEPQFDLYGGLPVGGTYFIDGFEAITFIPEFAGDYLLVYEYTDGNGCTNFAEGMIVVNPLPEFDCPEYGPYCVGDDLVVFEGDGVYTFDGFVVTEFLPEFAGTYTFTYTETNEFGCSASCDFDIVVNPLPVPECPEYDAVCEGADYIDFPLVDMGVYRNEAGDIVTGFDPAVAGEYLFTLTVTNQWDCVASCDFTIVVNPTPVVDCPFFDPVCEGADYIDFPLIDMGVYTNEAGDVVTGFDPAVAGDYMFTLTVTNQWDCFATCDFMITVNPVPVADCPFFDPVCEGADYIDFPLVDMGVYTNEAGDVVTGFDPAVAGDYMFTLTVTNVFDCFASCDFMITVNPTPVVDCPFFDPVCEGADYIDFPLVDMGVYTNEAGDVVTGFDPAVAGDYMFTLTVTNDFDCFASCDFMIVVNPAPVAVCVDMEVCENGDVIYFNPTQYETYLYDGMPITEFDPGFYGPGLYMIILEITNEFGCFDMCEFTILVKPIPVITLEPLDADIPYGGIAEFVVAADYADGYQWYGPDGMIVGADGASLIIESVVLADEGGYYCEVSNECATVTSVTAMLDVLPWTQVIDLPKQNSGVSTYLDLEDCSVASNMVQLGANFQGFTFINPNQVYVPGGASFCWTEERGAVLARNIATAGTMEVVGYPTLGYQVNVTAGFSYVPVWSMGVVNAADVFGPLTGNLFIAYAINEPKVYWPGVVTTLNFLIPGAAYVVQMLNPGILDFDVPLVDESIPSVPPLINMTSWNDVTETGSVHALGIMTEALSNLQVGDYIGIFNQDGNIAGLTQVNSTRENMFVKVYANSETTKAIDGFANGDLMTFKVYRDGEVIDISPVFDASMPNTNVFAQNGVSLISNLKLGATSVGELAADMNVNLYPNPATDMVNITTNFMIKHMKVVNYVGQVVFESDIDQVSYQINTSNFGSGMYFVQIETNDGTVITKRLTVR
nr:T9SS type A sorting domain-containing protein [Bacteroidota bacterium]